MSKLSLLISGTVFECEGTEAFIRSERELFYRAMGDMDTALEDEDSLVTEDAEDDSRPFRVTHKTVYPTYQDLPKVSSGEVPLTVGDILAIRLLDGKDIDFVVTDEDDTSIRLESRDCLGDYVQRNKVDEYFEKFYDTLPEALRDAIIPTERKYLDKKGVTQTETRKLFLPSAAEIFPPEECYGDKGLYEQMDYYKSCHNRIRAKNNGGGTSDWYWTASRYAGSTTTWCSVSYSGYANLYTSLTYIGAPVCFRISKS